MADDKKADGKKAEPKKAKAGKAWDADIPADPTNRTAYLTDNGAIAFELQ